MTYENLIQLRDVCILTEIVNNMATDKERLDFMDKFDNMVSCAEKHLYEVQMPILAGEKNALSLRDRLNIQIFPEESLI